MKARLDCAERHVGLGRDALEGHVVEEAQRDDLALIFWKALDRVTQPGRLLHVDDVLERVSRPVTDQISRGFDIGRDPTAGAGRPGNCDAPRDAPDPCSKGAIPAVAREGAEGLDERILGGVLSLICIAQHPHARPDHGTRFALDKQPVGVPVARQHGVDECSIVRHR